jgi:two-component system sensor histidine kinase QseC
VDQLLTLARLEPDAARPTASCDLVGLARDVVAELAPFALSRNVEIELRGSDPVPVEGLPDLLSVLLRNLVDNAVRYSPEGSGVNVQIVRTGDAASIAVSDEGPGIAPGERARIGQRFYRILGSGQSGSGLGLSIVQRIAEIHCAELRLDEGENGKGLRVVVRFPRLELDQ